METELGNKADRSPDHPVNLEPSPSEDEGLPSELYSTSMEDPGCFESPPTSPLTSEPESSSDISSSGDERDDSNGSSSEEESEAGIPPVPGTREPEEADETSPVHDNVQNSTVAPDPPIPAMSHPEEDEGAGTSPFEVAENDDMSASPNRKRIHSPELLTESDEDYVPSTTSSPRAKRGRKKHRCHVCGVAVYHMPRHLRTVHQMEPPKKKRSKQGYVYKICPVEKCGKSLARLRLHLRRTHGIADRDLQDRMIDTAKMAPGSSSSSEEETPIK